MAHFGNYWISPSGELHSLSEFGTHLEFIRRELGLPEATDEETLWEEGDRLLFDGWVRVTGTQGANVNQIAIQGKMSSIRRHVGLLEDLISSADAAGIRTVYVGLVRGADEGDVPLAVEPGDVLEDGLVMALNKDRIVSGLPASVMRRRPSRLRSAPIHVRGHVRRRVVHYLNHPPKSCLCHRSERVDRIRRRLVRRLSR